MVCLESMFGKMLVEDGNCDFPLPVLIKKIII